MSNNNTEVMELEFYKKEVCRLQELLEKEQKDFDEYQTDSRDLEETLTREIDDLKAEKAKLLRNIDLQKSQQKAQSERHDRERRDLLLNEQRLTKLLEEKRAECEELTNTVRKLETQNESLERSQRTGMQELSDLSDKLNTALERVVLVESELTETSDQNEEFQRLKEENNYLREELEEAKKSSSSNSVNGSETPESCICEMRNATNTINKIDSHSKPHKRNVLPLIKDPISVIIKMNQIVRDLLLKVDVSQCEMENKMARLNSTNASNFRKAFKFFDANNDGFITQEELESAMNKCGQYPSKLELRFIMSQGDRDQNGVITFDEFTALMRENECRNKYSRHQLREQFQMFDKDNDGYIERSEMTGIVRELSLGRYFPNQVIDQLFREADVDGDGRISFEEFVMAVN
ncbi:hypothetical protein QR680_002090 [Steinernema hermaphroditum]|uniref:EF-hand domain-containing protein n=1 Tax=Steinernema hermaphroditum TaxID=289476 RepID=A0AA39LHJ8_9BILA|nr:hypothetical protein QR680_002090 [Steinernema hermaphroditum]